jgi:hypothetical protein
MVQISLSVAKSAILNKTVGDDEAPWTPKYGFSSNIITALLETLGMPAETRFRLELHSFSCAPWFSAHAIDHGK